MTDAARLPEVDEHLCMGYGICNDLAPGVFVLRGEGVSRVEEEAAKRGDPEMIAAAVESCPAAAIRWKEAEA